MLKRLWDWVKMWFEGWIEEKQDQGVSVERQLAYYQEKERARQKLYKEKAVDVRELAMQMAQGLGAAKTLSDGFMSQVKMHLSKARAAQEQGDLGTEQAERAKAGSLAPMLQKAEAEVLSQQARVSRTFAGAERALSMVLHQAETLRQKAQEDIMTVFRIKMVELEEESLSLEESVMGVYAPTSEYDRTRQRFSTKVEKRERRVEANRYVLDALQKQIAGEQATTLLPVTAETEQLLSRLQTEVGYTPTSAISRPSEVSSSEATATRVA